MAASFISNPYVSHMEVPAISKIIISIEMSFTDFVFHIRITCGKKVMDVMVPAINPSICASCIDINLRLLQALRPTGVFFRRSAGATWQNTILSLPAIFHESPFQPHHLSPEHRSCRHA